MNSVKENLHQVERAIQRKERKNNKTDRLIKGKDRLIRGIDKAMEKIANAMVIFFIEDLNRHTDEAYINAKKLKENTEGALKVRSILTDKGPQIIASIGPVYIHTDHLGLLIEKSPKDLQCEDKPHEDQKLLQKIKEQLRQQSEQEREEDEDEEHQQLRLSKLHLLPLSRRSLESFSPLYWIIEIWTLRYSAWIIGVSTISSVGGSVILNSPQPILKPLVNFYSKPALGLTLIFVAPIIIRIIDLILAWHQTKKGSKNK